MYLKLNTIFQDKNNYAYKKEINKIVFLNLLKFKRIYKNEKVLKY